MYSRCPETFLLCSWLFCPFLECPPNPLFPFFVPTRYKSFLPRSNLYLISTKTCLKLQLKAIFLSLYASNIVCLITHALSLPPSLSLPSFSFSLSTFSFLLPHSLSLSLYPSLSPSPSPSPYLPPLFPFFLQHLLAEYYKPVHNCFWEHNNYLRHMPYLYGGHT